MGPSPSVRAASGSSALRGALRGVGAPTLLGLGAILLWSTTLPVARSIAEQVGALTGAASVNALGGVLSLAAARAMPRGRSESGASQGFTSRYLVVCGGLFVLYFAFLHAGLGLAADRHQALEVGLMNYLWPSLTLLLSVPLLGVPARWALLAPGLVVATAGVGMVLTSTTAFSWIGFAASLAVGPLPHVLGAAAALAWALYSNLTRRLAGSASGSAVSFFMIATGTALLALQALFGETHAWSARVLAEIGAMSIISTLGYLFWDVAMRRGDVALVATFSYFTPMLSTLFGSVYLGVSPSPRLWLGCALIVGAALVCRLATRRRTPTERAAVRASRSSPYARRTPR